MDDGGIVLMSKEEKRLQKERARINQELMQESREKAYLLIINRLDNLEERATRLEVETGLIREVGMEKLKEGRKKGETKRGKKDIRD
jgi:hypothetical protein